MELDGLYWTSEVRYAVQRLRPDTDPHGPLMVDAGAPVITDSREDADDLVQLLTDLLPGSAEVRQQVVLTSQWHVA